jgi:hypothetical protein
VRRHGPVEIRLPADPDLVSTMRLTASAMASAARCNVDEIDDIKLAVSEVLLTLLEHGTARTLTLTFDVAGDRFTVSGRCPTQVFDPDHPDLGLSRVVLGEVAASHSLDHVDSELRIVAHITIGRDDAG